MVELSRGSAPDRGWFEQMMLEGDETLPADVLAVDALVRAGWRDLATALVARWPERIPAFDGRYEWAEALLAEAGGKPEADEAFRPVLDRAVRLGSVRDEADALFHLGRCQLRRRLVDEATTTLLRSRDLWRGMRADAKISEVDEVLEAMDTG
jgi:hypothetical protein